MNEVKAQNTKTVKSINRVIEVRAEDLVYKLEHLYTESNMSELKLIKDISLVTNKNITRHYLSEWRKCGDELVSPDKVIQINSYFKKKGLSCIDSSIEEFKKSVDNLIEGMSEEKDFYKKNRQSIHPHTEVIDSFDDLILVEVKEKREDLSKREFLVLMFQDALELSEEDLDIRINDELDTLETLRSAKKIKSRS